MAVNIFGSYGKFTKSIVDRNYVDSKFILMLKNMQLKLDKNGDKMQGDLDMGGSKVVNLSDPNSDSDAVNKKYFTDVLNIVDERINHLMTSTQDVDSRILALIEKPENLYTLSTTGLVPHHIGTIDATGFIVTTSSNHGSNYTGHKVFNPSNNSSWRVTSDLAKTTNFWICIECPFEVKVYRFSIQLAGDTKLVKWKMEGCMDAFHLWEDLPFTLEALEGRTTKVFTLENPGLAKGYWRYRIFIEEAEGVNPGLIYWQLYTVNPVYST